MKKTLQMQLNSRRIKGLFASILENGSMVSLVPTWSKLDACKTAEDMNKIVATATSAGIITKVRTLKDGSFVIFQQRFGSVTDLITGFGWRIISLAFPHKVKFAGRLRLLSLFSGYIFRMYRKNGAEQVVKFLKAAQLAVQKSIGKDHIDNLRVLDPELIHSKLTGYGLPTIIPSRDRKLIAGGQATSIIRFWLTCFSIYRVISIPGKLKLHTIIAPFDGNVSDFENVSQQFYAFLKASSVVTMFRKSILSRKADLLLFEAASATHKVAWTGLIYDAKLLASLKLSWYCRQIMILTGQYELVLLFDYLTSVKTSEIVSPLEPSVVASNMEGMPENSRYSNCTLANPARGFAGKLAIKEEAAGKLRVFAMTDIWTQTALKPLEQMLAAFLKGLPNDGVYNQHNSELRCRDKALLYGHSFGYDLSAATDRLPLALQTYILNLIIPDFGDVWAHLLTKRDYLMYLPDSTSKELSADYNGKSPKVPNSFAVKDMELPIYYDPSNKAKPWTVLRYAVGQPMGALSSFAMLAVTHHFIVQFAYRRAYNVPMSLAFNKDTWYTGYECTGDDIIIFDALVAAEYRLLLKAFGMPINTTKSVCATVPVTEYLKVTSYYGANVGAISWKMLMSGNSLMGRVNILYHMLSKGVIKTGINPWIARSAAQSLHKPGNLNPTLIALWTMLSNRGVLTVEEALKALIDGKHKVFRLAKAILFNADVNKIKLALPSLFLNKPTVLYQSKSVETIWKFEKPWFGITMWKPLAVAIFKMDIDSDMETLTKSMMEVMMPAEMIPGLTTSVKDYLKDLSLVVDSGSFFTDGAPDLAKWRVPENQPDETLIEIQTFYITLLSYIKEKGSKLAQPILDSGVSLDSELPLLVDLNDRLARYNELKELVSRYYEKVDPDNDAPPARVVRPTELKLIKLLTKMGNRPLFTTALNA